jgi:hypothetical protein
MDHLKRTVLPPASRRPEGEFARESEAVARPPVTGPGALRFPKEGWHSSRLDVLIAFIGLCFADILIRTRGFPFLWRTVKGCRISRREAPPETIERICDSVDRACSYRIRRSLCLQRSALTTCLLRRHGVSAQMVIGCRVLPFQGHAWVEVDGAVVNDKQMVRGLYSELDRC